MKMTISVGCSTTIMFDAYLKKIKFRFTTSGCGWFTLALIVSFLIGFGFEYLLSLKRKNEMESFNEYQKYLY